jgi:hypothetical protein
MANIDQLPQRTKDLAAACAHGESSIIARHQGLVIRCLDPRPTRQPSSNRSPATR